MNASEIHCINSSFAHLVDRFETNGKRIYHHVRGGKIKIQKRDGIILNTEIKVEISCGELIDKLTILSIKADKIKNLDKLKNVKHEYEVLDKISKKLRDINPEKFNLFYKELKEINSRLWEIERNKEIEKECFFKGRIYQIQQDLII